MLLQSGIGNGEEENLCPLSNLPHHLEDSGQTFTTMAGVLVMVGGHICRIPPCLLIPIQPASLRTSLLHPRIKDLCHPRVQSVSLKATIHVAACEYIQIGTKDYKYDYVYG